MNDPYQINDSKRKDRSIASPTMLLPTKVIEVRQLNGSVSYKAFPRGQASRWTAKPVLQWLESLTSATEAIDRRGAIAVRGMRFSAPTPCTVMLPPPRPSVSVPLRSEDTACYWDLSYMDHLDPMAWMYTQQIKNLAVFFEDLTSMTKGVPITHAASVHAENLEAAYDVVQTRMQFTFDRIIGQSSQHKPRNTSDHADDDLTPAAAGTESEEVRALLDTLYEETIQKLKALIADHPAYQPRGVIKSEQASQPTQPPISKASQHQSKQELASYMTTWLRANFTNPYPDDEGLADMAAHCSTTNQVISNWLINARTRKWRPAIIKASEMGRPSALLLEDSINIFDGKPIREINAMDYYKKPLQQQSPARYSPVNVPSRYDFQECFDDADNDDDEPQPFKRFRTEY